MITLAEKKEYFKWFDDVKSKRQEMDSIWQNCAIYALPARYNVAGESLPKISSKMFDETAIWALGIFAGGLFSYLTSPFQRWHSLGVKGEEDEGFKDFLKNAEDKIFKILSESNFYSEILESYRDFGAFGITTLSIEEDDLDIVRFNARSVTEIYPVVNARGVVDTVFRVFKMTVKQAYEKWGDKAGKKVKEQYEAKKYEEDVEFLHLVTPRHTRDPNKRGKYNMPFASLWFEKETQHTISEGGEEENPYATVIYSKTTPDSPFGFSPAMQCLPSNKMLQKISETIMSAAEKKVAPPLLIPDEGFTVPINLSSKAPNYGDVEMMARGLKVTKLYETDWHDIGIGRESEQDRREIINKAFFVDLFLLLAQRRETKTLGEVHQLVEEKMMTLSAVLGRLMNSLLKPVIDRVFNIAVRRGKINLPQEFADKDYEITYISPLAKMQKISSVRDIESYLAMVGGMAEYNKEVLDGVNFDEARKQVAEIFNISPKLENEKSVVKAIRDSRAEQQREAAMLETAERGGKAYKDLMQGEKNITPEKIR